MVSELPAPSLPSDATQPLEVNGRFYHWPKRPTVVVCSDDCDPSYLAAAGAADAIGAGAMRRVCPITDPFVRHHDALDCEGDVAVALNAVEA